MTGPITSNRNTRTHVEKNLRLGVAALAVFVRTSTAQTQPLVDGSSSVEEHPSLPAPTDLDDMDFCQIVEQMAQQVGPHSTGGRHTYLYVIENLSTLALKWPIEVNKMAESRLAVELNGAGVPTGADRRSLVYFAAIEYDGRCSVRAAVAATDTFWQIYQFWMRMTWTPAPYRPGPKP